MTRQPAAATPAWALAAVSYASRDRPYPSRSRPAGIRHNALTSHGKGVPQTWRRPQARNAARSADLGRRAHGPPDAVPEKALSHREWIPARTRYLGLLDAPHITTSRREGVPEVASAYIKRGVWSCPPISLIMLP